MKKNKDTKPNTQLDKSIDLLKNKLSKSDLQFSENDISLILKELEKYRDLPESDPKIYNQTHPSVISKPEESYCKEIINHMSEIVWILGKEGKFVNVSQRAIDVLGYTKEELLTMSP